MGPALRALYSAGYSLGFRVYVKVQGLGRLQSVGLYKGDPSFRKCHIQHSRFDWKVAS